VIDFAVEGKGIGRQDDCDVVVDMDHGILDELFQLDGARGAKTPYRNRSNSERTMLCKHTAG
jgi:hypothetical protein